MEQKQEDSAILPPSSSSSSPSSSSSEVDIVASEIKIVASEIKDGEEEKEEEEEEEEEEEAVGAKDVDDDGYQTPTSPRHRIPPAIECPPAPKKPAIRKRRQCARIKEGTRRVRRRIEIESAVRRNSDDSSPKKKKKKKKKKEEEATGDVTAHR